MSLLLPAAFFLSATAEGFSYVKNGREHPFSASAVGEGKTLSTPEAEQMHYELVGTLGHALGLDALLRLPDGLIQRLGAGAVFDEGRATVLEVRANQVRIEFNKEIFTLQLSHEAEERPPQ